MGCINEGVVIPQREGPERDQEHDCAPAPNAHQQEAHRKKEGVRTS